MGSSKLASGVSWKCFGPGDPPPPSCKQVKLPQCIQQGSPCPTGSPSMRARGPAAKGHAWNYHPHRKRAKSVLQGWPHGIAMQRNNRANDRRGGAELVELIEMQSPLPLSWVLLQLICSFLSQDLPDEGGGCGSLQEQERCSVLKLRASSWPYPVFQRILQCREECLGTSRSYTLISFDSCTGLGNKRPFTAL